MVQPITKRDALGYLEKGLQLSILSKDTAKKAMVFVCMANIYLNSKDPKSAIEYYEKALGVYKKLGRGEKEYILIGNMAIAYSSVSKHEKAIEYYEKAISIAKNLGDKRVTCIYTGNLARTYLAIGLDSTETYIIQPEFVRKGDSLTKMTLKLAQEGDYVQAIIVASRAAYNLATIKGDYKYGLEMLELFITLRDSITSQHSQQQVLKDQLNLRT